LLEFDHADFGITNLQTFASQLTQLSKWVDVEDLIAKVTTAPRLILQLPVPVIEVDEKANLTLFDPNREWRLDEKTNFSKAKNSPWWGQELKGKAVAVFNNNKQWIDA
jgi:dihydroorotase